MLYKGR